MPHRKNLTWFYIEEIPHNNHFMMGLPGRGLVWDFPRLGAGSFLRHYLCEFKEGFCKMAFPRSEFNKSACYISSKMIRNPKWTQDINKKIIENSKALQKEAKKVLKIDLTKLSNRELIKLFERIAYYHRLSHVTGTITTWVAEAEKERFSRYLAAFLEKLIKERGLRLNLAKVFSTLTTPTKDSFTNQEKVSFIKIALEIKKHQSALKLFKNGNLKKIKQNLFKIDQKIFQLIKKHFKDFCWLPYMYEGPAYDLEYFLSRWQGLIKEEADLKKMYRVAISRDNKVKKTQRALLKKLRPDQHHLRLIRIAQNLVWLKAYRKDTLYFAMYCYEGLFREIGKRLGLSLRQIRQFLPWEIPPALLKQKFSSSVLDERFKYSLLYVTPRRVQILTGRQAQNFIKKLNFEKPTTKDIKELRGSCASPGQAQGKVKIINVPEDIPKMKKGDILVSPATNPNLMSAIKLASAIITNVGGLTCHAAIVSRELKIPCIVGTLVATQVLKDGDRVQVKATEGIVRKL